MSIVGVCPIDIHRRVVHKIDYRSVSTIYIGGLSTSKHKYHCLEMTFIHVKFMILLNSLPESYDNLITTLMWGKETLELEEITCALLSINQMKKASDRSSQGEGLVAKGNQEHGRNKSRSESSRNKA